MDISGISNIAGMMGMNPMQGAEQLGAANTLVHKGQDGMTFAFELPKAIQGAGSVGESQPSSFLANQIGGPTTFGNTLQQMVMDVNDKQISAGDKIKDVLAGGSTSIHEAMIAVQESGVAFTMISEMRNKLVEGYQELMRTQI
jgi:flagellar hook-basal body complex protein FliE